ncbi:MAG: DUF86 domain-containing protein [Burkholderiaceae bacterium]|jgi:uncharacterized protein with HEPN domain|nr:DUF86 domain-containing protein [Burkholderiaceae bacterium]MCZ8174132.1 DUF86 domain-containing protein [Burkholderiaceae bacterium]
MSARRNKHLLDALAAAEAALQFLDGMDAQAYATNSLVRSAVERQLTVLGEAARRALSDEPGLRARAPDLAFAVALRNRLVHGYDVIDDRIVFDTVVKDLPGLARQLRDLLAG